MKESQADLVVQPPLTSDLSPQCIDPCAPPFMVFRENRRCVLSPVCVEKKETTQQQQQQQQLLEFLSSVSVS